MSPFFPDSPFAGTRVDSFLKRLPRTLIAMALVTGISVQLYTWLLLVRASASFGFVALFLAWTGSYVLLLTLTTVYLGNHPVRQWIWRVPLFLVSEWVVEVAMVAILIRLQVERNGTDRAQPRDFRPIVLDLFYQHGIAIIVFSVILGIVVQIVRFALLKHEKRDSTAIKIHQERVLEKEQVREQERDAI